MNIQGINKNTPNTVSDINITNSIIKEQPVISTEIKNSILAEQSRIGELSTATISELFERANFTKQEPDYSYEEESSAVKEQIDILKSRLKNSEATLMEAINLMLSKGIPLSSLNIAALNAELDRMEPIITAELEAIAEKDVQLFEEIKDLSESEKVNAIKSEDDLTFDSVYKAKHAAANTTKVPFFDEFEAELAKLVPEEKQEAAKLFYENGVDLTEEKFKAYNDLTSLKEVASENVREFSYYSNYAGKKSIEIPQLIEYDALKKKLSMVEAQVKLTTEAALNLTNIDINTKPAMELLEHLKSMEAAYLNEVGGAPELFEALQISKDPLPPVFKSIVTHKALFNIETISTEQVKAKAALGYAAHETVPNAKFGDSFAKVKDQLGGVLEGLKIPVNEENIRIASIMSRAGIDITPSTFEEVYIAHKKIDYVQNKLNPSIALELLKSGENLLKMPIEELIEKIDAKNPSIIENIAEHIVKLEGKVSPEEREKLIAIYKTLHRIDSFGGAGLGINLKNINTLTLGHLLDGADNFAGSSTATVRKLISDAENTSLERAAKIVEDVKQMEAGIVNLLEKSNVPVWSNIALMSELVAKPRLLSEILEKEELTKIVEHLPTSAEGYLKEENKIETALYEKIDLNARVVNFTKTMKLQNRLNTGSYSFPINFKGSVVSLHMFVPTDFSESPNIVIAINGAEVFINTSMMDVFVKGASENETLLREIFEARGFFINNIVFDGKIENHKQSHKVVPELTKQNMFALATCITKYLEQTI
ncbi:MAG: DUF6240 domain-containing protein [Defluviitaleaceae bacterium]|nr:DUF6240 domain-containing protein [Defluviitaleaceae bacterium]